LRDIGDARISLDEVLSGAPDPSPAAPAAPPHRWRPFIASFSILLLAVAAASVVTWNLKPAPPPQPVTRTVITLPAGDQLGALDAPAIAISPDGTQLAYVATHNGTRQIYLRALDSLDAKPLSGTEAVDTNTPFFSPDGQSLGFFGGNQLKKIQLLRPA